MQEFNHTGVQFDRKTGSWENPSTSMKGNVELKKLLTREKVEPSTR